MWRQLAPPSAMPAESSAQRASPELELRQSRGPRRRATRTTCLCLQGARASAGRRDIARAQRRADRQRCAPMRLLRLPASRAEGGWAGRVPQPPTQSLAGSRQPGQGIRPAAVPLGRGRVVRRLSSCLARSPPMVPLLAPRLCHPAPIDDLAAHMISPKVPSSPRAPPQRP